MKTLLLLFIAFLSVCEVHAELPEKTVNRLVEKVRAVLPQGWRVSYEPKHAWLEVSRTEPVKSLSVQPNGSPLEKPEPKKFEFALRLIPGVPDAEYRRLQAENARIQEEMGKVYQELVSRRVAQKFDSFSPATEEARQIVSRYEALKNSRHSLPDFRFEDISLEWGFNSPDRPTFRVVDEAAADECQKVLKNVTELFAKYDPA